MTNKEKEGENMWGSILSGVAGIGYDIYKTNSANKHAKRAQQRQMAWQEEMSNTAHQREVADLRAAGINPIYTATGGSGASTPSGSPGQAFKGDGDLVNSAVATYRARLENKAIENQAKKITSDIRNSTRDSLENAKTQAEQQELLRLQQDVQKAQLPAISSAANLSYMQNSLEGDSLRYLMQDKDYIKWYQAEKKMQKVYGTILPGFSGVSSFSNSAKNFSSLMDRKPRGYSNFNRYGEITGGRISDY